MGEHPLATCEMFSLIYGDSETLFRYLEIIWVAYSFLSNSLRTTSYLQSALVLCNTSPEVKLALNFNT